MTWETPEAPQDPKEVQVVLFTAVQESMARDVVYVTVVVEVHPENILYKTSIKKR